MKIALIRQKYTPFGGAERYMSRLIDGLMAAGHEVHVLAARWETGGNQSVTFHKVQGCGGAGWMKALTFSANCRKILGRESFDVVFSLERILHQDIYRAGDGCHRQWLVQKNLGKGILAWLLTYLNPLHLTYLYLERRLFGNPGLKAIIANSNSGKDEIVRLYGVSPEKIHVVYNGIDPDEFDIGNKDACRAELAREFDLKDEVRLLYVGSGFKRKGVPALLQAVARLKMPFKLFIVGKGRIDTLKKTAQKLGIGKHVIFTGPRSDIQRFYLGSDIFVFPTLYDPFSNATLEAMACGLPVITTKFNGVAELIEEGQNGFVLNDPLDAGEITRMIELLSSDAERRLIGEMASKTAGTLTMSRNVRETMRVIETVVYQDSSGANR